MVVGECVAGAVAESNEKKEKVSSDGVTFCGGGGNGGGNVW